MTLHYCERWLRGQFPTEPWSEGMARKAHDRGEVYSVLFPSPNDVQCVVQVASVHCMVDFFDAVRPLIPLAAYQFKRQGVGQLFLEHASVWTFPDRSSLLPSGKWMYRYRLDGAISCSAYPPQVSKNVAPRAIWAGDAKVDVSANWEPFPTFGEYESIARRDRGLIMPTDREFYVLDPRVPAPRKDFVRETPHSFSLYFTAKRGRALDEKEGRLVEAIDKKFAVEEKAEAYGRTGNGLNWVSLHIYEPDPAHPEVILQGSTRLPTNTEMAPVTGLEYWCAALTEFRRAIPDADWSVSLEEFDIPWNEAAQHYEPNPRR